MANDRAEALEWVKFFGGGLTKKKAPKDWPEKVLAELDRRGETPGKEEVEGVLMELDWHIDY